MDAHTIQRADGTFAAVVSDTECTHHHGSDKAAAACLHWETTTLQRRGTSAWKEEADRKSGSSLIATVASSAAEGEASQPSSISYRYIPSKDLVALERAVAEGAKTAPAENLFFIGPNGSGKTEGARDFARRLGLPFVKVDAASMTDPESWFGTRELVVKDGVAVTEYKPSEFVTGLQQPCVLFIDEINRIRDEHRNVLIPVLDHTRQVLNPLTGEIVYRHPQNFIVMAGNVGIAYTGTSAIDPAFTDRSITVEFDYLSEANENTIVRESTGCDADTAFVFVKFAGETRAKAAISDEYQPVSTRKLLKAAALVKSGLSRDLAIKFVIFAGASKEGGSSSVRQELENLWTGIRDLRSVQELENLWTGIRDLRSVASTVAADSEADDDPQQISATQSASSWQCPVHGRSKVIPAGVSAKTGKPYKSFRACPTFGCQFSEDRNPGPASQVAGKTCTDCGYTNPAGRTTYCTQCGASL